MQAWILLPTLKEVITFWGSTWEFYCKSVSVGSHKATTQEQSNYHNHKPIRKFSVLRAYKGNTWGQPDLTKRGTREEKRCLLDIWELFVIGKEESSLSEMFERTQNLHLWYSMSILNAFMGENY